jgi:hypothetical protein
MSIRCSISKKKWRRPKKHCSEVGDDTIRDGMIGPISKPSENARCRIVTIRHRYSEGYSEAGAAKLPEALGAFTDLAGMGGLPGDRRRDCWG